MRGSFDLNGWAGRSMAGLLCVLLLAGAVAPAMAGHGGATVNPSADPAQNPYIEASVTKDAHDMDKFGDGTTGLLTYFDNEGDAQTLPAVLNESKTDPVTYDPTEVEAADFGAFPHDTDKSALNASHWTVGGTNSSKLSVSNSETADNVEAVRIHTDGTMGSGDIANAVFSDFQITSDESKRTFILGGQVNTLESGAVAQYRLVDEDGDYKMVTVNSSANVSKNSVLAASTGSFVEQVQLGKLTTQTVSGSDGTFDNVEKVKVVVTDGDYDGAMSIMNAEKMGTYDFGTRHYDGGDDDTDEEKTETITDVEGSAVSVTSLTTLGSAFDSATLHHVSFPAKFPAAQLSAEDIAHTSQKASNYENYDYKVGQFYRLKLVSAYDLSYSNAALKDTVAVPSMRYLAVEYAEGTGNTDLKNVSGYTDVSGKYDSLGETVTLDSTIQPGQNVVFHSKALYTADEKAEILPAKGGGAPMEDASGNGGFFDAIFSPVGGVIGAILAFLGVKKKGA